MFPEKSTPEQAADLLDAITAKFDDYRAVPGGRFGLAFRNGTTARGSVEASSAREEPQAGERHGRCRRPSAPVDGRGFESGDDAGRLANSRPRQASICEWNSDLLKALIVHGVEARLRRGEECTDLVSRRLFGARPWGYGPWCLQMAIAANEITASSFYLRELYDCVVDGVRADGLTVDAARARLASHAALLNQFDELVEGRARGETRPGHPTAPASSVDAASPEDTAEQRKWQAAIEARAAGAAHGPRHGATACIGRPRRTWESTTAPQPRHPGNVSVISSVAAPT